MTGANLRTLTASVNLLRDDMKAAKLAYLRELLALRTLQGRSTDCDRITRQLANLLNTQRPKSARKTKGI